MRTACYAADGAFLWVVSGSVMAAPPTGQRAIEIEDGIDPERYTLAADGQLSPRVTITPTVTTRETGSTIAGLPSPCVLMVGGVRVDVTGGRYDLAPAVPIIVTVAGAYRSADIVIPPVQTPTQAEAEALTSIDQERETRQMQLLTTGGAKKYVYGRKAIEVDRAAGIIATLLDALSLTDRSAKYPYAHAEALVTGEKLSVVLARFAAGLKSSGKVEAIEARAQAAKRAVKAATTAMGKRAAAAVNWGA